MTTEGTTGRKDFEEAILQWGFKKSHIVGMVIDQVVVHLWGVT